jgi:hypothetical protein
MAAKDRAFIKGQRYTVLSYRAKLTLAGRRSLGKLLGLISAWPRPTCSRKRSATLGLSPGRLGAPVSTLEVSRRHSLHESVELSPGSGATVLIPPISCHIVRHNLMCFPEVVTPFC